MARYYKHLTLLTLFLCLLSCQEGREAGELLGMWRETGTETNYISFSGTVALFRNGMGTVEVFGNFQHHGDSLFIQCYSKKGEPQDTSLVEESFGFKPFNDIRLKIETIDADDLVLTKGHRIWHFDKY